MVLSRFRNFWEFRRDMRALTQHAAREAGRAESRDVECEHLFAAIADGCFGTASTAPAHLGIS